MYGTQVLFSTIVAYFRDAVKMLNKTISYSSDYLLSFVYNYTLNSIKHVIKKNLKALFFYFFLNLFFFHFALFHVFRQYEERELQVQEERAKVRLEFENQKFKLQNQIEFERSRDTIGKSILIL